MRTLFISQFMTLDGVVQAPGFPDEDRSGGFDNGGWQVPFGDEVFGQAITEGMNDTGAFLLGRRTYDVFAAFWPNQPPEDEFAKLMNEMPTYVASRSLEPPLTWRNSTLLEGDAVDAVRRLKEDDGKALQVIGSEDFAQSLIANDLVDEYRLMIHPILLGKGKRLFHADDDRRRDLELVDSKVSTTGVIIATYRRKPA